MDYVKHGKMQGRELKKDQIAALYFTMCDIVHVKQLKRHFDREVWLAIINEHGNGFLHGLRTHDC